MDTQITNYGIPADNDSHTLHLFVPVPRDARRARRAHRVAGEEGLRLGRAKGVEVTLRLLSEEETGAEHCQHDNPTIGQEILADGAAIPRSGLARAAHLAQHDLDPLPHLR